MTVAGAVKTFRLGPALAVQLGRPELSAVEMEASTAADRKAAERRIAGEALHCRSTISLQQVHGATVVPVDREAGPACNPEGDFAIADAMLSSAPGLALMVRTADCLPLLFCVHDGDDAIIGAVHAGWRGMQKRIIQASLLAALQARRFDRPRLRLDVFIGPHISAANYEVGPEVAGHFVHVQSGIGDRSFLDLQAEALDQCRAALLECDIDPAVLRNTGAPPACTVARHKDYYSHRMGDSGRNLSALCLPSPSRSD